MGDLRSGQKAIERVGGDARIVTTPDQLAAGQKIIMPGVAAFGDAMAQLRSQGLVEPLVEAIKAGVPYLGFCLGLQLLFEFSSEDGRHQGLGIFEGEVIKFHFDAPSPRQRMSIPHMGWNQIHKLGPCPMLEGIADESFFYFAHSYHVAVADESIKITTTDYGYTFTSSVWKDNIFATQFYPEKSQSVGLRLLKNFVTL